MQDRADRGLAGRRGCPAESKNAKRAVAVMVAASAAANSQRQMSGATALHSHLLSGGLLGLVGLSLGLLQQWQVEQHEMWVYRAGAGLLRACKQGGGAMRSRSWQARHQFCRPPSPTLVAGFLAGFLSASPCSRGTQRRREPWNDGQHAGVGAPAGPAPAGAAIAPQPRRLLPAAAGCNRLPRSADPCRTRGQTLGRQQHCQAPLGISKPVLLGRAGSTFHDPGARSRSCPLCFGCRPGCSGACRA